MAAENGDAPKDPRAVFSGKKRRRFPRASRTIEQVQDPDDVRGAEEAGAGKVSDQE